MKFLTVLSFGVTLLAFARGECMLPDYLQNDLDNTDDYWRMRVNYTGQGNKVHFYGDKLVAMSDFGDLIANVTCDKMVKNGSKEIYFFNSTEEEVNNSTINICVYFEQWTANVVQAHVSATVEVNGTFECPVDDLEVVDWPLIAHIAREPHSLSECPVVGGYMLRIDGCVTGETENDTNITEYCKESVVPGQLQSECTPAEGMFLQFPDVTCIPRNTGWGLEQSLVCLDKWSTDKYDFALVGEQHFEPKFCMRVSKDGSDVKMFQDLFCPDEDPIAPSKHYLQLNLQPKKEELCADDIDTCEQKYCDLPVYGDICRKTCSGCTGEETDTPCKIDDGDMQGTWRLNEDSGDTTVTIKESTVEIESFTELACHHKQDVNMYVMKSAVKATCLPRYTCTKFGSPGTAVLQYQLSQFDDSYENADGLCDESNFHDDIYPVGDKYRSTHMKTLVDEDSVNETENCGFKGNYLATIYDYTSTTLHCEGHIGDYDNCTSQKYVKITANCTDEEGNTEQKQLTFNCLASIDFGAYLPKALITVMQGTTDPECWIKDSFHNPMHFYVMPSAQCDAGTLQDIRSNKRLFNYQAIAIRADGCDGPPTTDRPIPTIITRTFPSTHGPTTPTGTAAPTTENIIPSSEGPIPGGKTAGQVVGIVFGVLLLITVVGLVAWCGWRQYLAHKQPYRVL